MLKFQRFSKLADSHVVVVRRHGAAPAVGILFAIERQQMPTWRRRPG